MYRSDACAADLGGQTHSGGNSGSRARICKPFKEPRNRFPVWRHQFLGKDTWAPWTFTNTGSDLMKDHRKKAEVNVIFLSFMYVEVH